MSLFLNKDKTGMTLAEFVYGLIVPISTYLQMSCDLESALQRATVP